MILVAKVAPSSNPPPPLLYGEVDGHHVGLSIYRRPGLGKAVCIALGQ
jgi:hypothetical protein